MNFDSHSAVTEKLSNAQNVEEDNRDKAREAHDFLEKRDGQWDPDFYLAMTAAKRPLYTFDKCNPIIDQIAGEIDQADFDIRVRPAGGDSTKEDAKVFDGLIRNIESISNASRIYSQAAREMIGGGIAGWEVVQEYADSDSFEQDLLIKPLSNFESRVWFDPNAELQDMSDAMWCVVTTDLGTDEYDLLYPEGSKNGVGSDDSSDTYEHKRDSIKIGRLLYKKEIKKELVLFSDGSVREQTDDLTKAMDELAQAGITEEARRTKSGFKVFSRLFDGSDWLNDEQETVFEWLPVIPAFANFAIREGKTIWHGAIDKLMDGQRVYNALRSREVEEVIYSPRAKYWATKKMVAGHTSTIATLNTNSNPVQTFNPDPEQPQGPVFMGGAQVNQGLQVAAQTSNQDITEAAGLFGINQGDVGDSPLSGVAIQSLQNKGDNGTIKYFKSVEVAICHTARILVKAIPIAYDTERQVRILNEDGSFDIQSVNERVFDTQTQQWLTVNDLSKGKYDVTCDVGPAFKNRQQETVKALSELIAAIPGLGEQSADVLLKNINSPGIDVVAERIREMMLTNGQIPESQQTEEEKQELQQRQQMAQQQQMEAQQNDPATIVAMAEAQRVQAETADIVSKSQERQQKIQIDVAKLQLQQQEADNKAALEGEKLDTQAALGAGKLQNEQKNTELNELKIMMQAQQQQAANQQAIIEAQLKGQQAVYDMLNQQAQTLNTLREAIGADTIVSPDTVEAYNNQAELITEQQERI